MLASRHVHVQSAALKGQAHTSPGEGRRGRHPGADGPKPPISLFSFLLRRPRAGAEERKKGRGLFLGAVPRAALLGVAVPWATTGRPAGASVGLAPLARCRTQRITDPAPLVPDMTLKRHNGVRCIWFVRCLLHSDADSTFLPSTGVRRNSSR
jgi:hypothetical protein